MKLMTAQDSNNTKINVKHHWHNGNEFENTLGDSEGQGSLKESDMT